VAEVGPVGAGEVEAVRGQVRDAGAQVRQRTPLHAPPRLGQPPPQRQAPQAVQALEGGRGKHHLLHRRVQHQLQGHHRRQLAQVVGQAERGRLRKSRPTDAAVQVLRTAGEWDRGGE
jgi:hypothetical protein